MIEDFASRLEKLIDDYLEARGSDMGTLRDEIMSALEMKLSALEEEERD